MQHGIFSPLRFQFCCSEAFKKALRLAEIAVDRADQELLPEAARTGKEYVLITMDHVVDVFCLVNVKIIPAADFLKSLYTNRIFHYIPAEELRSLR